ncbi:MAG: class I SAM-dependent methyltransferase [Promethearchaeota archaeon]
MSHVYIKALETAPKRYDKGINWLSWGGIEKIRNKIAELASSFGSKVLEIGAGTASQAIKLAQLGMDVVGIDHSPAMLSIANNKLENLRKKGEISAEVADRISLLNKAAVELDEFDSNSFDVVTSTLGF